MDRQKRVTREETKKMKTEKGEGETRWGSEFLLASSLSDQSQDWDY
jgi:hypothetical protein